MKVHRQKWDKRAKVRNKVLSKRKEKFIREEKKKLDELKTKVELL